MIMVRNLILDVSAHGLVALVHVHTHPLVSYHLLRLPQKITDIHILLLSATLIQFRRQLPFLHGQPQILRSTVGFQTAGVAPLFIPRMK